MASSSISVGFVAHCEGFRQQTDALSCPDADLPWRCPCLQVMDVQLYGGLRNGANGTGDDTTACAAADNAANNNVGNSGDGNSCPYPAGSAMARAPQEDKAASRFYALLHDTQRLLWAVAPPHSALAQMLSSGAVEIGSLVTLSEYAIVEAANGRRLVVVLAATCSVAMPFSLIGRPALDPRLYRLSANSLVAKQQAMEKAEREAREARQRRARSGSAGGGGALMTSAEAAAEAQRAAVEAAKAKKVLLADLWENYAALTTMAAIGTWHMHVRVLWRSKLRRAAGGSGGGGGYGGGGQDGTQHNTAVNTQHHNGAERGGGGKFIFDAVVCDERGDAVRAVFMGRRAHEMVQQGRCYRVGGGSVHVEARNVHNGNGHGCRKRHRNAYGDAGEEDDEDLQDSVLVPVFVQFQERTWMEEVAEGGGAAAVARAAADAETSTSTARGARLQVDDSGHSPVVNERESAAPPPLRPAPAAPQEEDDTANLMVASIIIPHRPARLLSGAEDDFVEVKALLETSSIGDLVSFKGVVSKCGALSDVHTRNGRVERLALTVKDRASHETIDVTLWGPVAQGMAPFLPMRLGTTWCFRDVTVRMYGASKTISSRSSSEVQLMSSLAHMVPTSIHVGVGGVGALSGATSHRAQQRMPRGAEVSLTYAGTQFGRSSAALTAAGGDESVTEPSVAAEVRGMAQHGNSTAPPAESVPPPVATVSNSREQQHQPAPSYPFQVSLAPLLGGDGTTVAPSPSQAPHLLKIQSVTTPFVVPSCRQCGRRIPTAEDLVTPRPSGGGGGGSDQQSAASIGGGPSHQHHPPLAHVYSQPVRCGGCGKVSAAGAEPRFAIALALSDGLACVDATAYGEAAEALCGEDLASFVRNCGLYGAEAYTNDLVTNLIGLPVLVGLTRIGGSIASAPSLPSASAASSSGNTSGSTAAAHVFHVTVLQHVDLAACALVMADMLGVL